MLPTRYRSIFDRDRLIHIESADNDMDSGLINRSRWSRLGIADIIRVPAGIRAYRVEIGQNEADMRQKFCVSAKREEINLRSLPSPSPNSTTKKDIGIRSPLRRRRSFDLSPALGISFGK